MGVMNRLIDATLTAGVIFAIFLVMYFVAVPADQYARQGWGMVTVVVVGVVWFRRFVGG